MHELIKVESHLIGGEAGIRTVNARELHGFLGVKSEFRNWIKNRIEHQKPAVEFFEKYSEAESTKNLSDVAKLLGFKPHTFPHVLAADGAMSTA